jgi:hypothetical protein
LRRRGDDYDVAQAAQAAPVAEQLNRAAAAAAPAAKPAAAPLAPRGMGPRGAGARTRPGARGAEPPPDLLLLGVVDEIAPINTPTTSVKATLSPGAGSSADAESPVEIVEDSAPAKRGRGGRKKAAAKKAVSKPTRAPAPEAVASDASDANPSRPKPRRGRGKKTPAPAAVDG